MKSTSPFSNLVKFRRGQQNLAMAMGDPTGQRELNYRLRTLDDGNRFRRYNDRLTAGGKTELKLFNEKEVVKGFFLFVALYIIVMKVQNFNLF